MKPTLLDEELVYVNKIIYKFQKPERKDVIAFYPTNSYSSNRMSRIIGLPGETIEIRDGKVIINGSQLIKKYTSSKTVGNFNPILLSADEYFVMGDHRNYAMDSREFGPIQLARIIGKASFVRFPSKNARFVQ